MKSAVQRKSLKGGRALPTRERQHSGIDSNFTAWPDVADPGACSKTGVRLTLAVPLVRLRWNSALGRGIELPSRFYLCVSESGAALSISLCSDADRSRGKLIASVPEKEVGPFLGKAIWRLTNPELAPEGKGTSIPTGKGAMRPLCDRAAKETT
jgi:hypothetical protein